jgi:hypothetical protein
MSGLAANANARRSTWRHLWAGAANLALAGFFVIRVWHEATNSPSGQLDPSPFPYSGALMTAAAAGFSVSALVALRLAPGRSWTRLLDEVASYAGAAGLLVGGLLLLTTR